MAGATNKTQSKATNAETLNGKTATLESIFEEASRKYNLPLNLLKAVAKQESDFNPNDVSHSGAVGIMQLMPDTAKEVGVTDRYNIRQNIMGGAKYLSTQMKAFGGNLTLALAAYNAGPGSVRRYGGVPPYKETQDYVKKVTNYMKQNIQIPNKTVDLSNGKLLNEDSAKNVSNTKTVSDTVAKTVDMSETRYIMIESTSDYHRRKLLESYSI
ncbi:MAG: lytic transglycosylase domain-containing protein [Lachnospiraceae bacterium]|nr:lytic transglycosylase domain-containing protein [Lachnospiraceae bacterium]